LESAFFIGEEKCSYERGEEMKVYKALTIAGSDSGGGAGIQADLKTFAALGVYGSSVITALTAQNTEGVAEAIGVAPDFVAKQLDVMWADIGADAVKTGMLFDADIIEVLADRLRYYAPPWLIVDPVMVATSGDRLLSRAGEEALRDKLLPLADFVTPNQDEAEVICGYRLDSEKKIKKCLADIHQMGVKHVILTGVQKDGKSIDYYHDGYDFWQFEAPFINTSGTHGTGCSYSAALAAFLARGFSTTRAISQAKEYINCGLAYAPSVGRGNSPLNHMSPYFPGRLADERVKSLRAEIFRSPKSLLDGHFPLLNVILGGPLCAGKDYASLTRKLVKAGARLIQFREKSGETRDLIETAGIICSVCHEEGALFVVNDRVDIAMACGADGVHLGQGDMDLLTARSLLGPDKIIGISAGNVKEALAAQAGKADYIGVGPVYHTDSKECSVLPGGPPLIKEIAAQVDIPILAIGGVTPENTPPLLAAGAAGVSVISAVLASPCPEKEVARFMKLLRP